MTHHLAILYPTCAELADAFRRLGQANTVAGSPFAFKKHRMISINHMNSSFRFFVTLTLGWTIALSPLRGAGSARENERLQHGKITKNEAQHLVLKKFPGAKIKECELKSAKGHSYFAVELIQSGASAVTKVQVDGLTGKITP